MTFISDTKPKILVSTRHKQLVVPRVPEIDSLLAHRPTIEVHGESFRVAPHDLSTTRLLRRLGFSVASPMLTYYLWGGATPFESQRVTCDLLSTNYRFYVLNGMGTGKTKAALWAWDYLRSNGLAHKALICAPLSTLEFTWMSECFGTIPHMMSKGRVLHGTKAQRLKRLADPDAEFFVINHDGVGVIFDELQKRPDIDTFIIDELASFRNVGPRQKVIREVAKNRTWVWGLTGSPMPRAPTDVYGQAKIVTPERVELRWTHFRDELMTREAEHIYVPKPDAIEKAYRVMQPAVRYRLADVAELPPVVYRTGFIDDLPAVEVAMSAEQTSVYNQMKNQLYAQWKNNEVTAANAGVKLMKLVQIAAGWVYDDDGNTQALDATDRLQALVDLVEANERKVMVLVPFRHALLGVSRVLDKAGVGHAVVHGDVTGKERANIFTLFQQTDKYHVLLADPGTLSHGLTLTAADTALWYAPITRFETYEQTNHRIIRIGQKYKQQIVHMQASQADKYAYGILRRRDNVQKAFLALFEGG